MFASYLLMFMSSNSGVYFTFQVNMNPPFVHEFVFLSPMLALLTMTEE